MTDRTIHCEQGSAAVHWNKRNPEKMRLYRRRWAAQHPEKSRQWAKNNPERFSLCQTWVQIRQRCSNPRHPRYKDYGGRGITVCERWEGSFDAFVSDMGPRLTPKHTLDRIDNDGPYSAENCRWATRQEQSANRRNCIYVQLGDERVTLKEACRRIGLKYRLTHQRITRDGWTVERAIGVRP